MPTSALTYFPFTYVGDENIEDFLEKRSSYAYSIAFLGTSGMVVTQNNIYGVDLRNLSYVVNDLSSYIEIPSAKAVNDRVQEAEIIAAEALYDLNSRVETIDRVTGEALIDIYNRLNENSSYYDVTYVPTETFSKVNGNYVNSMLVPIDTSSNLYEGDQLSDTVIKPWLSPIDKHLEISAGASIMASYVIVDCKLIGECTHDNLSIMNDNGTIKMWSMLPLDVALVTASKVLVKYYE